MARLLLTSALFFPILLCGPLPFAHSQTRLERVLADKVAISSEGFWIYNDLESGFEAARNSGQPMLVTLRCIPCEECVKLDEELIESDATLRKLLDKFVRVRVVATNGLDLSLFQYDYDQSFAMLIVNADGTLYGRFGTRSDRTEWSEDVSLTGLAETLRGALQIHENYPDNRKFLADKQGKKPLFKRPEEAPSHRGKFPSKLQFNDNVVKNCIHCHMIGDAQRELFRSDGKPLPTEILFQYPHPKFIGMIMDPETRATVKSVKSGSAAERSGLQAGDQIQTMAGQAVLSLADLQWVLHNAAATAQIPLLVQRGSKTIELTLRLDDGWRAQEDLSWRVSTWGLRRMVTGGLVLKEASAEDRERLRLANGKMALRVDYVGQYNEHAAGKRAGFRKGDLIVSFDGRDDLLRETDLIAYAAQSTKPGDRIEVTVLRDGNRQMLQLPMQK